LRSPRFHTAKTQSCRDCSQLLNCKMKFPAI
jgi:hypothetical protein